MQTKVSVHLTPDKSAAIGGDGGDRGVAGKGQIAQAVMLCREKEIICGPRLKILTNIDLVLFSTSEEGSIATDLYKESFHFIHEAEYQKQFTSKAYNLFDTICPQTVDLVIETIPL